MSDDAADTPGRDASDADGDAGGTTAGTDDARGERDGEPGSAEAATPDDADGASDGSAVDAEPDGTSADRVVEMESDDGPGEDGLVARVAARDEELAREVADLRAELEDTEERVADLESKLKRKAADFENYKKRAERRREEMAARATEDLVERLVGVRDDLVRALDQDEDVDIRDGVAATLDAFDRVLAAEDVESIDPEPGEETDPHRHEVMMRVESDRPEGTVVDVYRPGYVMADRVLQTAQVTVSEGPDGDEPDDPDA